MVPTAVSNAFALLSDPDFTGAVRVSLGVAVCSTSLAAAVGVPAGFIIGISRFRGKRLLTVIVNTLMALPTVVVGLIGYSLLSRSGPLGSMGLLFTPVAMALGQWVLALPIVTGLSLAATTSLDMRVWRTAQTLGAGTGRSAWMMIREGRFAYLAAVVAGFGRVFAEIGVSLMLGGNIRTYTRTITTTIAMETNKGEFGLGLALGAVLLLVALAVNILFQILQGKAESM